MPKNATTTTEKTASSNGRNYIKKPRIDKSGYSGILLEPIISESATWSDDKKKSAFIMGISNRFTALFEHYKISSCTDDKWFELAMALALVHVPGFRCRNIDTKKGRGAPNKWQLGKGYSLYLDVNKLRLKNRTSIAKACDALKNNPPYKGETASNLVRRYKEAVKSNHIVSFEKFLRDKGATITPDFEQMMRGSYLGPRKRGGK